MSLPSTTHQAAREGWRIRVVCRCGRTGMVDMGALLARPDRPISEIRFRCPREGCRQGRDGHFIPPDYKPPAKVNLPEIDPFARVPNQKKVNAMWAGILSPQGIAQVEREQLLARQKRKPSLAWTRAP